MPISPELKKAREVNDPQAFLKAGGALRDGQIPTINPAQAITTGEITKPVKPIEFNETQENETSFPTVDTTKTLPTEKEQGISSLIEELTASSDIAGQKEAFRVEQEKEKDIEGLLKSEQDYLSQYRDLEAEFKNVEMGIQKEFAGRGVTKGGVAPIQRGRQRDIAMRANTVSALLASARGEVAFAQSQIDRAVNNKFAVREAERTAKMDNLNLLLRDPTLTLEQKDRANAQLAIQNEQKAIDDQKKVDTKTIMDWALKAQEGGATPAEAQYLMELALTENPDIETAFALFSPFSTEAPTELDKLRLEKERLSIAKLRGELDEPETETSMFNRTLQEVIDLGGTPEEATLEATVEASSLGISLTASERADLLKIAKGISKTPELVEEEVLPQSEFGGLEVTKPSPILGGEPIVVKPATPLKGLDFEGFKIPKNAKIKTKSEIGSFWAELYR